MARKELGRKKNASCVMCSDSETSVKSVAMVHLVKTEKPGACVTVNCKVCRSAIAM
jgi:hypothetical protein